MKRVQLVLLQVAVGVGILLLWHVLTAYPILAPTKQTQFFFSTPVDVLARVWKEFTSGEIWGHLWITLLETVLAFAFGAGGGIVFGFLFARRQLLAAVFDPYIKAANSLPRVVLAPIFALWFGLGIWSKVALGFTLVFFIVFFNVYQGVRVPAHLRGLCLGGRGGGRISRLLGWARLQDPRGRERIRRHRGLRRHGDPVDLRHPHRCARHPDRKAPPGLAPGPIDKRAGLGNSSRLTQSASKQGD
jgi:hypothetical protein